MDDPNIEFAPYYSKAGTLGEVPVCPRLNVSDHNLIFRFCRANQRFDAAEHLYLQALYLQEADRNRLGRNFNAAARENVVDEALLAMWLKEFDSHPRLFV